MWLLLTHAVVLAAVWGLTEWEIRLNHRAIARDGSADTLKERFHLRRGIIRTVAALLIAGCASLPVWGNWDAYTCSVVALLLISGGWFLLRFNPGLNRMRGLPEWYVSFDARAAYFPDRYVAKAAVESTPFTRAVAPEVRQHILGQRAGCILKRLLRRVFAFCVGLYVVHLVLALAL